MSTSIQAIRLRFTGGLHIGRGAEELDKTATTYNSDALKSALFAVGLPYYPQWAAQPALFFNGFRISSAFPWCGEDLFLPKPGDMRFQFEKPDDLTEAKRAKKISYVAAETFRSWASNPEKDIRVKDIQIGDSAFLFTTEGKKFLYTAVQQRAQVPAGGEGDTRPYYFERLLFAENSGLYFLISFQDEQLKPQVMHALHLLGDQGIGTDRTVGNGQFEMVRTEDYVPPVGNKGVQVALGLYLPSKEEVANINLEESYWSLIRRGGYIAGSGNQALRSLRKNNIYFFGEGSTFKCDKELQGRFVDLQPSWNTAGMHPVWRCGKPLFFNL